MRSNFRKHQSYSSQTLKTEKNIEILAPRWPSSKNQERSQTSMEKTKTQEKKTTLGEQFLRCLQEVSQKSLLFVNLF